MLPLTTNSILQLAGATLLALFAIHLLVLLFSQLTRLRAQGLTARIEHEHLLLNLRAARLARKKVEEVGAAWNGSRKFAVSKRECETSDVCSFYLTPHDQKPLPGFKPGQYLTFAFDIPGQSKKVIRCYSLSDRARPDYYRVTIKRALGSQPGDPHGIGSGYFHDVVKEGAILDVKAPSGHFFLDTSKEAPVVLISAGVGITPCLSMLNELAAMGSKQEIWWFYGARNSGDHILKDHVLQLAAKHENIRLHVCYSTPRPEDRKGIDYQHDGRVRMELLKELLPSNNYDYYLCGPGPLMDAMVKGLTEWGVPEERVHFEAFGPASVKRQAPSVAAPAASASAFSITFDKSGKTVKWDASFGSLLDLANANGVALPSGCCAGQCGTCVTAIRSGEVTYIQTPGNKPDKGTCLACVAIPNSDLIIDA